MPFSVHLPPLKNTKESLAELRQHLSFVDNCEITEVFLFGNGNTEGCGFLFKETLSQIAFFFISTLNNTSNRVILNYSVLNSKVNNDISKQGSFANSPCVLFGAVDLSNVSWSDPVVPFQQIDHTLFQGATAPFFQALLTPLFHIPTGCPHSLSINPRLPSINYLIKINDYSAILTAGRLFDDDKICTMIFRGRESERGFTHQNLSFYNGNTEYEVSLSNNLNELNHRSPGGELYWRPIEINNGPSGILGTVHPSVAIETGVYKGPRFNKLNVETDNGDHLTCYTEGCAFLWDPQVRQFPSHPEFI